VRITFLSYKEKWLPITLTSSPLDLGTIVLAPSADVLDQLEITAERSQMELRLDKRVFNVGKDLSNLGGTASDVLDNIPSINVDTDGTVSLRGSQNVRILINGKPSGLIGSDPANALKMFQADMIDRVEIITNPSARYEAEGEVGIINIILKKEARAGINGSATLTGGLPTNNGIALGLNYRKKSTNFFVNYTLNNRYIPGRGENFQSFSSPDTSYIFTQKRTHVRGSLSHNIQAGTDIYINDKNSLTISGLYKYGVGDNFSSILYSDFDEFDVLTRQVTRNENEIETKENIEGSINYVRKFKGEGHELVVDARWIRSLDLEQSVYVETPEGGAVINQRSVNTENEENKVVQIDYVLPLGKDAKFEAGARSAFRTIENLFLVEQEGDGGEYVPIDMFNDIMVYTENIHAAYGMFGNKYKKLGYQVGVRAEYSDVATNLLKSGEFNPRKYLNLFPSMHLSREMKENNSLQFSISRRLSRPSMWNLLPFFTFSDSRVVFSGNPDLDPEFTYSFETGHLKNWDKGSLLSSVYYRRGTGVIQRITFVDEEGFTRVFPINLAVQNSYGVEFNANRDINKWWKVNANGNFFRAIMEGEYNGQEFFADTYTWTARANSRMTLFKKLDTQLSFDYRARQRTPQGIQKSIYFLNAGLSMDVLKGNGTLSFSARDIFNTRKRRWVVTTIENFSSESEFQWQSRQFVLSFSYRLNQKKKKEEKPPFGGEGGGDF
jgi:outer membrane receptor protein involved in Fe transport